MENESSVNLSDTPSIKFKVSKTLPEITDILTGSAIFPSLIIYEIDGASVNVFSKKDHKNINISIMFSEPIEINKYQAGTIFKNMDRKIF